MTVGLGAGSITLTPVGSTMRISVTRGKSAWRCGINFVAGLQSVQVAEEFPVDIVMGREHHVAHLAGVGTADAMSHAPFQLLPPILPDDGCRRDSDGGDEDALWPLRPRRRHGHGGQGLRPGSQVSGNLRFVRRGTPR